MCVCVCVCVCVYIIVIIMSCRKHGFPWLSPSIYLYRLWSPCEGVYWRMLLISSPLLLYQFPVCLIHLIWMVSEMGKRWPYSCYFFGCYFWDLFNMAHSILVQLPSSFFSRHLVSVHVVNPYSSMDTTTARKTLHFILLDRSDFHMMSFSIVGQVGSLALV